MTAVTARADDAQRRADLRRLRQVRDRIDREYAQPLNLAALARGAHLSVGHLSRAFKAAYGEAPYEYLMTRRVERAQALLRRGDLSVTEVRLAGAVVVREPTDQPWGQRDCAFRDPAGHQLRLTQLA